MLLKVGHTTSTALSGGLVILLVALAVVPVDWPPMASGPGIHIIDG